MIAREFPFTAAESKDIETALRTYHSKISARSNKDWFKYVDVSRVLISILRGEVNSALVDGFLVVYDIGTTWYTDERMLEEMMVLRITPGGSFHSVTSFLESKARAFGCKLVSVGTALARNDKALASMYESEGYTVAAVQLSKQL